MCIADNKLALNAGWDEDLLAEELKALLADDLGFDIGVTGFSIPEIDGLVEGLTPEEPGDPEDDWLPDPGPARCRPGDVWQLGPHRLICGNALDREVVRQLMDGETGADGLHRSALQRADRRPCRRLGPDQASRVRDGLGRDDRRRVHRLPAHQLPRTWPRPASTAPIHFICMDWRHMREVLDAGRRRLCRAEEPDRLGEGQRRHGHVLPLPPRADLRLQGRHRAAHQQLRARPARALPHQRLAVPRGQHAEGRPAWPSSSCTRR